MWTRCLQSVPAAVSVGVQACTCTGPAKRLGPKGEILPCNYDSVMASTQ